MKPHALAIALSVVALTGCASALNTAGRDSSSCPGIGPGACASPGDVYAITSGSIDEFEERIANHTTENKIDVPAVIQKQKDGERLPSVISSTTTNPSAGTMPPELAIHSDGVAPVRMPAQVMRIRVFPWTDKNDNLHSGGYVYTEIEQRKWTFGVHEEGALRNARIPHRVTTGVAQTGSPNGDAHSGSSAASQTITPPVRPQASRNAPSTDLSTLTLE